ncbi:MAG: YheC/YheD family protein [Syntrophomonadaceae bacterium]|nr:YheC/YheD family protein [Syntrophomonadaceae bacterium]MDD3897865.1 YheC/YheD family protein [Syntrophomonadaceae bacterium]MDD4561885.1 YheC/YheD family protein [Syntrophomonadaceae bacterium]
MKTAGSISISRNLVNKLGIDVQPSITVRVGSLKVKSKFIIYDNGKKGYALSPELVQALHIKKYKGMKIRYQAEEKMLHLGPTIGILATLIPGSNREELDPRSLQAELIYLSIVSKTFPGQVYIFTPGSINWANHTCRGYVYHQLSQHRGRWESSIYPLPDVVYDRIHSRSAEARNNVQYAKNRLMKLPYLHYFNPHYLNKWNVHQILLTDPMLIDYLPETRQLDNSSLEEMLKKYRVLYMKPSNGSLGKGIIKVNDDKGHLKYIAYKSRRIRSQASNPAELMRKTKKQRAERHYIVQQGLDLAKYKGSPFDLRIIYQKNGRGEWQISKKFCRIAPQGSSISNLSSGGRVEKNSKVLHHLFKKEDLIKSKNEEIRLLCKMVASTLETVSNSTFGELGMDIGIDRKGHLYLIEVNSKPRKTTETMFSAAIVKNTFKRPLAYAAYLAGFKVK